MPWYCFEIGKQKHSVKHLWGSDAEFDVVKYDIQQTLSNHAMLLNSAISQTDI